MRDAGAGITGLQEAVITLNTYKYDSENFKKDFQGKTKGSAELGKPFLVGRGGNKPSENFQSLKPNKIKVSSFISIYKTDSLRQIYDSYLHEKELNIKSAGLPSRFFIKFV